MTYQFIVCTPEQWADVQRLELNIKPPRIGRDGRMLTNMNGNIPFADDALTYFVKIGVEIIPSTLIFAWLSDNGWEGDPTNA